jgi:hypothetical protein
VLACIALQRNSKSNEGLTQGGCVSDRDLVRPSDVHIHVGEPYYPKSQDYPKSQGGQNDDHVVDTFDERQRTEKKLLQGKSH